MDNLHIIIFLLLGVSLFLSGMAIIGVQNNSNANLTEAVNGILETQQKHGEQIDLLFDTSKAHTKVVANLRNQTNDKFDLFQNEIVKIKLAL